MRRSSASAVTGLALCLALGCTTSGTSGEPDLFDDARPTTVRLIVINRNFNDARLYGYRRDVRMPLGIAPGKTDTSIVLDWDTPEPMRIEIDLLAGPRCFTETMQVEPGDILELQIAPVFWRTAGCRYEGSIGSTGGIDGPGS